LILAEGIFKDFYPALGQPAGSPERLALINVIQYLEDLSDRQAAEAVRSRIDWKYVLGLALPDWLRLQMKPEWFRQNGRQFDSYGLPTDKAKREELAVTNDKDGFYLLRAIYSKEGPQEKIDKQRRKPYDGSGCSSFIRHMVKSFGEQKTN
jgi:hypothetical protein